MNFLALFMEDDVSLNPKPIIYWMNERWKIRQKRYSDQPWPWTKDPIFQTYKFCEVFRRHDRETRWIVDNWLVPYKDHPNLWFCPALYRQINWHPTLAEIGFPEGDWEVDHVRALEIMRARAARGEKNYTGAYVLWGGHGDVADKPELTLNRILLPVWRNRHTLLEYFANTEPVFRSIEYVVNWFKQFEGFSGFLGYEAACDLTYTPLLSQAHDRYTWANPGPGAVRGLNRLHGRPLNSKIPEKQAVEEMQEILEILNSYPGPLDPTIPLPLEMRDVESGLCETDKYLRVQSGEGKPRSKFVPPHLR